MTSANKYCYFFLYSCSSNSREWY